MNEIKVILISGRRVHQGVSLEIGKTSNEYIEKVAVIELNKRDAEKLGISDGEHVKVKTDYGSVVVKYKMSEELDPGLAFMPYGPWVNQIISPHTRGTGIPGYKGVAALVSPAREAKIPTVKELVERLRC